MKDTGKDIISKIESLNFSYKNDSSFGLNNINLSFKTGKIYAILGQNGSGKSTLLSCIDGLNKNYTGNIFIYENNEKLDLRRIKDNRRAKLISYVSQHNLQNSLSVYDNIMLGRRPHINISPMLVDHETTSLIINKFKLNKLSQKSCLELSGGEFQKVCIARAFAQKTPIVLMDEPTNNLDINNQYEIFNIFKESAKSKNLCIVCVVHDVNLASKYADELIFMKDGKIKAKGDKSIVDKNLLKDIYGVSPHIFEEGKNKYIVI